MLYEEAVRIPLIVRYPGVVPAGRVIGGPVELIDVVPTVLGLLGLEGFAAELPGRSLVPALRDGALPDLGRRVFLLRQPYGRGSVEVDQGRVRVGGMKLAVREGRWKFISDKSGVAELYNLEADPGETRNRIAEEPETARRLARWRARYRTPPAPSAIPDEDRRGLEALGYAE